LTGSELELVIYVAARVANPYYSLECPLQAGVSGRPRGVGL
jgi:hypothetical protein